MTEIASAPIDFIELANRLADPKTDLTKALSQLVTLPPAKADAETSVMPTETLLTPTVQKAMAALPDLFGKVQPVSRRMLNGREQDRLREERKAIDEILAVLGNRKDQIADIVGTHFDVAAEKKSRATETTARDAKGHYLIAAPGAPEIQDIPGGEYRWVRQRTGDKTTPSMAKFEQALNDGQVTREEYLKFTKARTGRDFDEDAFRKAMVSEKDRPTAQKIFNLTRETKPGNNSIHLKPIK